MRIITAVQGWTGMIGNTHVIRLEKLRTKRRYTQYRYWWMRMIVFNIHDTGMRHFIEEQDLV